MKDEREAEPISSAVPFPPSRILIVRTDRLGDVVLTLPMVRAIKHAFSASHVAFLARDYTRPIVERSPDVDETLVADPELPLRKLIAIFRGAKADVAFFPSPRFRLALAAWMARIPRRVGTGYRWYSMLFTDRIFEHRKMAERHEAEFNIRMLTGLGISVPEISTLEDDALPNIRLRNPERAAVGEWLAFHLGNSSAKFAVLHVTNGGSTPAWPIQNFVELGRMIFEQYGFTIILTGLRQEEKELGRMANSIESATRAAGFAHVFAGHSLPELAALVERAEVVVASGTGPGHLAAALGANTIGLFPLPLALSKARWGFQGSRARNLSPDPVPGCLICEHCTCMERLEVRSVMKEVGIALRPH